MGSEADPAVAPGRVIRNRDRLWRVDAVEGDVVEATPIGGPSQETHRFYAPVEDIAEGRLEPPRPDRVGNPAWQRLMLQARRLSMVHGTAPLVSLQRSRVIPTEYQLTPVVMSLDRPRVRMLLADDVGLGKTIEAGLITSELLARNRAQRMLVVVPATLREQWREALNHFFHIDARIISTRHRRQMEKELPPGASPWEHYDKLIASVDYVKQLSVRNQVFQQDWDICIVDEAHKVAKPHQSSPDQTVDMQRWEFARRFADQVTHLLLLTATPHNGYTDSFASLLRMLDVGAVDGPQHEPRIDRSVARNHVVQRRREDVEEWFADDGESPLPKRDSDERYVTPGDWERSVLDGVRDYGEKLIETSKTGSSQGQTLSRWTVLHFLKRALSSPEALRRSIDNRIDKLENRLETSSEDELDEDAGIDESVAQATALDNDPGERYTEDEAVQRIERVVTGTRTAVKRELEHLKDLQEQAERVTRTRDSKLQYLMHDLLPDMLNRAPRVIVFTKYTDTLEYLATNLDEHADLGDCSVVTMHGSLSEGQRRERFLEFESAERAVLVATDVISEGLDLQHACNQVVHYELPWNPNRLEQRNGRVNRFGQPKDNVYIRTLVVEDKMDAHVLEILIKKAANIRDEYGFSPPYFGDDAGILEMIKDQGLDIGLPQRTIDEFGADTPDQGTKSAFDDETLERIKQESFYGHTDVELTEVRERLQETQERMGGPDALERFVERSLNLFDCVFEEIGPNLYRIEILEDRLLGTGVQREYEPVTFDAPKAADDPQLEMLDLAHPLVQQLVEAVEDVAYSEEHYGRTAARGTDVVDDLVAVYTVLGRYVADTQPNATIMEELLEIGLPVFGDEPLARGTVDALGDADPKPVEMAADEIRNDLEFALDHDRLDEAIQDRVEERRSALANERRQIRERLEESGESPWSEGFDDVSVGSIDLLTVTLYYPR